MEKVEDLSLHDLNSVEFIGKQYCDKASMQLFSYNKEELLENKDFKIEQLQKFSDEKYVYWLNLYGLHDVELIKELATKLNVHYLVIQDLLDTTSRPKLQHFDDYIFFTVKAVQSIEGNKVELIQISFLLGKGFVLSFQEKPGNHFQQIRKILRAKGTVRERGSDFLQYALLEAILEDYFFAIDKLEISINDLMKLDNIEKSDPASLFTMEALKETLQEMKRSLQPLKEAMNLIEKGVAGFIKPKSGKYFADLKDQSIQLIEELDFNIRKLESGANLFFSYQSHKMNDTMKTLTVISAIFIPLTFLAGIYGMNFDHFPEIHWYYGYHMFWAITLALVIVLVIYFKRKKWL
ncbi:MAG: magnesium/cobalt transporter CorA [Flavobacteriales bacterium]